MEALGKDAKNSQNLMVSKGGETKVRSSGTSIASKQAKEHSNQSSKLKL